MLRLIAILVLVPSLLQAGTADDIAKALGKSNGAYDYFCTGSDGRRHEMGDVVCLINNSCTQTWLAKCDMSLNNPMWRKVQDGCPAASLLQRFQHLQPGLYSVPVDALVIKTES